MTHLQLTPTIPLDTPKGPADAHFLIDYGSEANLLYVCFVRETGECWTFKSQEVLLEKNITAGIRVNEGRCQHGVVDGDWCAPCNLEVKQAREEDAKRTN
jgi:hypothetical protein